MKTVRILIAAATLCSVAIPAAAQQAPPAEEPGWAKGRPKTDIAMKMAPVPAFPIPTAAADLPTKKFKHRTSRRNCREGAPPRYL